MSILKGIAWFLLLCVGIGLIVGAAWIAVLITPFLFALALLGIIAFTIGTLIVEAEEDEKNGKPEE